MNNRKQIVLTHIQGKQILLYMENEIPYDVLVGEEQGADSVEVGDIYVGKVQNILQNIGAAFVEVKKDVICYLPLSECTGRKVRCGDELAVQVRKAAVKTKQAVVTLYPEMAGRYCVVSTKTGARGISRKINDPDTIHRLNGLLEEYGAEEYGILLRTNAAYTPVEEIRAECRSMVQKLHERMEHSQYVSCFSLLHREDSFYVRYINSCRLGELDRIITDDGEIYQELQPLFGDLVQWYQDASYPLDKLLGIQSKLAKALQKRVWLKSGGNLVIEPTEALTVIDVNTGKAVEGKRNKETTFFKLNCEAAVEAARQIRVRNLSGIILIDFIDMKKKQHQDELMSLLREELAKDKIRTALVDITKLGLVEITRMKKNKSLYETLGG